VSRANWGEVALSDVAAQELRDYGIGRDGRVVVDGPGVLLKAKAAVGIGMALHELAANAAKHGALSVPHGRVHLGWAIEEADGSSALVIRWRESGGPAIEPPETKGYGRELIETDLHKQLGATGSMSFAEGGIAVSLVLPLAIGLVLPPGSEDRKKRE
jgi:two-component sensor histidine kinase